MNLSVFVRFIMFRIITRSVDARGRTGATDSPSSRQCWWSTRLSLAVDDACVMVVQCPRLFRKPLSLGAPVAEPAKAAPFCKARPERGEAGQPERPGTLACLALYLGEEGTSTQEKAGG